MIAVQDLLAMISFTARRIWFTIAGVALGLALASILLTQWFRMDPCHLCIFQRLLFMLLSVLALGAALTVARSTGRVIATLALTTALTGAGVAAYQSWFQLQPAGNSACVGSELGPIERLIEWLGQAFPSLFLATGFCDDPGLTILGLSLANWALIGFLALIAVGGWALRQQFETMRRHGGSRRSP